MARNSPILSSDTSGLAAGFFWFAPQPHPTQRTKGGRPVQPGSPPLLVFQEAWRRARVQRRWIRKKPTQLAAKGI